MVRTRPVFAQTVTYNIHISQWVSSYPHAEQKTNVVVNHNTCLGGKAPRGNLSVAPCSTQTLGQAYNTRLSSSKYQVISKER